MPALNVDTCSVLSLCAGIGGLDLGLRLALPTARTVLYLEREATAAAILAARFADGSLEDAPIWSDLRTFDGRAWRGCVDILTAGYPCQPFSVAGQRRGEDDPRHLWPHVARIIRECEPTWVFLENVGNHLKLGFREVALELREMGFRVEAGLFTAEEVGAPHRRERLFALAFAADDYGRRGVGRTEETTRPDGIGRRGSASGGDAMAYAERAERGPRNEAGGYRSEGRDGCGQTASTTRERRENLAYSGLGRSPELGNGCDREPERAATVRRGFLFPPGPGDFDAWRELLAIRPEIEPAICGSFDESTDAVDGYTASRVDRLRALGNGVVPACAAVAYSVLRRRLEQGN